MFQLEADAGQAVRLLAVHGLCLQGRGNHAAFAADLDVALGLVHNLKYHSPPRSRMQAGSAEYSVQAALDHWLERAPNQAAPLAAMLAVLHREDARPACDTNDALRADYLIALNTLRQPEEWIRAVLPRGPHRPDSVAEAVLLDLRRAFGPVHEEVPRPAPAAEAAFLAWAWQVPWERARQERLLRWVSHHKPAPSGEPRFQAPWPEQPLDFTWQAREAREAHNPYMLTAHRAALLQVALRLYLATHGRPAPSLDALVQQYLTAVPVDPYDPEGKPFRYRVSRGETVRVLVRGPYFGAQDRGVPAGEGILYSVGPDGRDDGGRRQLDSWRPGEESREDILFLIPAPNP
jgi:hypothetical protein